LNTVHPEVRAAIAVASGETLVASLVAAGTLARLKALGLFDQEDVNQILDGSLLMLEQFRVALGDPAAVDVARARLEEMLAPGSPMQTPAGQRPPAPRPVASWPPAPQR